MLKSDKFIGWLLFVVFSGLYIHTLSPEVPPYRDAGEMVVLAKTLGVAHQPGYPLYTLVGHWLTWLPIGNVAYQVNMLSALCGSAALVFLYLTLRNWLPLIPSLFASATYGLSNPFWELANVPEMYTMGILAVTLIFYACFVLKSPTLTFFILSLSLGVRMDLLLLTPVLAFWFISQEKFRRWDIPFLFSILGGTVFFYMLVRSHQDPLIDWSNPETLRALFSSVSRESYGRTLDLLSLSYKKGENFAVNMSLYIQHIIQSFGWLGVLLPLVGAFHLFKKKMPVGWFLGGIFLITCPIFLFLANMPPNPHAVAIVEAAYPVPDILLVMIGAFGLSYLMTFKIINKVFIILPVFLFVQAASGYEIASKRHNYFAKDYVTNVLRCTPKGAVVAFHEDVQLFSLWKAQLIDHRRKDLSLISKGLSASPWYWDMLRRWGTKQAPAFSLKEPKGYRSMKMTIGSRPFVIGQDIELNPTSDVQIVPHGLLAEVQLKGEKNTNDQIWKLIELGVFRGHYRYEETPDFFSSDLIGDYARAILRAALQRMNRDQNKEADYLYQWAESLDPTFGRATTYRGFLAYKNKDYRKALALYERALVKHKRTLALTGEYKSLPATVTGVKREISETHVYAGVAAERLGDKKTAQQAYAQAIDVFPTAQAHYNLAVTYWDSNWSQVVFHLEQALKLEPNMASARQYLGQARYRLSQQG